MIIAEHINKSFGETKVLKDISLTVPEGGSLVILGASGSGKSTLLSVLSGLEKPDSGALTYNGLRLDTMNDDALTKFRKKEVGFIFQQYYLLPHLSVRSNVKLGANLANNDDYKEIINAVKLGDKLNAKPSTLSGGEQQRVCIARALAKKPNVLFLDEPTGALDEETGREVLDYLLRLQRERGFTMITVTHNENIARTAKTVVRMNSGRIVETYENEHPEGAFEIGW